MTDKLPIIFVAAITLLGCCAILSISAAFISMQISTIEANKAKIYAINGCKEKYHDR